jgi:uncharacterized protein YrrD
MTATFTAAEGRSVVASDTAESIGEVKGFVVDPTASRVDAVHVAGRGKKAEVVAWRAITSFGKDAVMADSASTPEKVSTDRETQSVKGNVDALGSRVLLTTGFEAGTVVDVEFDTDSGDLTNVRTEKETFDGDRLVSLGSYALVVAADT